MTNDHTKVLDDLIAAVEMGGNGIEQGLYIKSANAFTPESAYGKCTFHEVAQAFYGSLDAANALHEALLPGVMWQRCQTGQFCLFDTYVEEIGHSFDTAKNPARAWLIAILKAYRAQVDA